MRSKIDCVFAASLFGLWGVLFAGCASVPAMEPKSFLNSSADMNGGVLHEAKVIGVTLDTLMLTLNELASKRGLVLVRKFDCSKTDCRLVFKSDGENRTLNYSSTSISTTGARSPFYDSMMDPYSPFFPATTTRHTVRSVNLAHYSRYFISLTTREGAINVGMVGVPVLNEEMSCPQTLLKPWVACTTPIVRGEQGVPLSDSLKKQWGYDISGAVESDVITGIFAELSIVVAALPQRSDVETSLKTEVSASAPEVTR